MPFLLLTDADLTALPTSGTAWNRLVAKASTDPGTPNLGNLDQPEPAACLSVALRYAKDGGGLGKARCVSFVQAAMGTESGAAQPLNPYRVIGTIMQIADLVGMTGAEVGRNGQTFNAWVQSLPYKVIPGQTNWNTLWKCSDTSGNNWGACARTSLLACALWMVKKGLTPTGVPSGAPATAGALRDAVIARFKRWCGDTSVPNTFVATGAFQSSWAVTAYPGSQGPINPVSSLVRSGVSLDGAQAEDASRSTFPTTTGAGQHYQYESLESAVVAIAFLVNNGYSDAKTYGSNGVRRNYQYMMRNNLTTPSSDYHDYFSMQWPVVNWLWNIGFPSRTITGAQRRLLTTHTDWLTSSGSTWLNGATQGSTTPTPVVTSPNAAFTLPSTAVSGDTVTLDVSSSTAGSAPITRYRITWGDGSAQQTITPPTTTAPHAYSTTAAMRYTVTVVAEAADGGTDPATAVISVSPTVSTPVARFTITPTTGGGPLTVNYDFTGSFDPSNRSFTRRVDWGDGTVTDNAPNTGTHVFGAVADQTGYSIQATITADTDTSLPVTRSVTVNPTADASLAATPYIVVSGQKVPLIPAYNSAWDGTHLVMGPYHLWFDPAGLLRVKTGPPTGPTDGVAISGDRVQPLGPGQSVPSGTPAGTLFILYR